MQRIVASDDGPTGPSAEVIIAAVTGKPAVTKVEEGEEVFFVNFQLSLMTFKDVG